MVLKMMVPYVVAYTFLWHVAIEYVVDIGVPLCFYLTLLKVLSCYMCLWAMKFNTVTQVSQCIYIQDKIWPVTKLRWLAREHFVLFLTKYLKEK